MKWNAMKIWKKVVETLYWMANKQRTRQTNELWMKIIITKYNETKQNKKNYATIVFSYNRYSVLYSAFSI